MNFYRNYLVHLEHLYDIIEHHAKVQNTILLPSIQQTQLMVNTQ